MKLIIQPDDGVQAVVGALNGATKSIKIAIFRCDHPAIEKALVEAVQRGIAVHALIASTNRGGALRLRGLETRLLAAGAVVARTNNDLPRYHGKYVIVDDRILYVLSFNFTRSDLTGTRSFGIETEDASLVRDASQLFLADSTRRPYELENSKFLVSPVNARKGIAAFLEGAHKSLQIYDVDVSDSEMTAILRSRAAKGVKIQVIGSVKDEGEFAVVRSPHPLRLHLRMIIRDREDFVLGSQSLRKLELDMRREVGVQINDAVLAERAASIFDLDWQSAQTEEHPAAKVARRVAKAVTKELGPMTELVEKTAAKNGATISADSEEIENLIKEAVDTAVRDAVREVVSQSASDEKR